ncbi:hypothetical protein BIWAKO_05966 [Bosea sp. BIWAKO-01]|nr:hypothetical protein BIWAKO_05966 [Bosea sp. BIWAKO-01]
MRAFRGWYPAFCGRSDTLDIRPSGREAQRSLTMVATASQAPRPTNPRN